MSVGSPVGGRKTGPYYNHKLCRISQPTFFLETNDRVGTAELLEIGLYCFVRPPATIGPGALSCEISNSL